MTADTIHQSPAGSSLRLTLGLPIAALITAILFLAMGAMIRGDMVVSGETREIDKITITRTPPPETSFIDRTPMAPPTEAPPPPVTNWPSEVTPSGIDAAPPRPAAPDVGKIGPVGPITANSALLKFQPTYPQRCAARGLEGTVTMSFDVTAAGNVVNARVVSSSNSCFDRAAMEAIRQWKFRPSGGGSAVVQRGVTKTFRFELQG